MWDGLGLRIMLMCLWVGISCHAHTTLDHAHQKHLPLHRHRERSKEGQVLHRTKRGWVWNQFFVIEEYTGPDPVLVGRLHSDVDSGNGNIKYVLSGEGAGTIFVIDDKTGNIHATKTLDREEQAQYTLIAQAVARDTNKPLEPPSQFVVKVQDINDNPPEFLNGPYYASVPEMAGVGTSVIQVTATDADDPTYGNSAMLVYSILQGQPYFSVEPQTGIIRTALPNMDREARQEYDVVIQAKDMGGHMGGLSGTTEVKIVLTDVNDNPPKFPQMQTTWGDSALRTAYYEGLAPRIQDELAGRELPTTLEGLIQLALRIDQRMSSRPRPTPRTLLPTSFHLPAYSPTSAGAVSPPRPVDHSGAGEPMQLGRASLTTVERDRRYREGLCAYRASPKHHRAICHLRPGNGAAGNFIDQTYAKQLGVELEALPQPVPITVVDGRPLTTSPITHQTQFISLSGTHGFFSTIPSSPGPNNGFFSGGRPALNYAYRQRLGRAPGSPRPPMSTQRPSPSHTMTWRRSFAGNGP
nr:cadherin-11-like [Paramormyrops kingsleyae]